jgi:hypothetical protein
MSFRPPIKNYRNKKLSSTLMMDYASTMINDTNSEDECGSPASIAGELQN